MKMSAKLLLPILIALAATIATAQNECPTIIVTGPAGIPDEGALIPFYAQVTGKVPTRLTYRWSVSTGKIVEGQGTDKAKFDVNWPTGATVTATVHVVGLPSGCPNTASESMGVAIDPGPIYVGSSAEPSSYTGRVNELIGELEKYPGSQGYIFIGTASADRSGQIGRLIRATASENGLDQDRLTIRSETTSRELIELWLIRPGVDNPPCKACDVPVAACPAISVTGPAGITNPGDSFHFTATIDKAPSNPIDYRWTVSTGSIVDGQGTDKIRVEVDWEAVDGITVTATVEVLGLAKECPNTYSETAGVSHTRGAAVLEDEYSTSISRIDNARLLAFVVEMNKSPSSFAYIYEYFVPGTRKTAVQRKISRTKAALVKAGIAADRFKIEVVPDADQNLTRLYRVPPRADIPMP